MLERVVNTLDFGRLGRKAKSSASRGKFVCDDRDEFASIRCNRRSVVLSTRKERKTRKGSMHP